MKKICNCPGCFDEPFGLRLFPDGTISMLKMKMLEISE